MSESLFKSAIPLAERMRPKTLQEFAGQTHLTGQGGALSRILAQGFIPSLILWGPPGVGKTTLARIVAKSSGRPLFTLSATGAGVKDVREVIEKAKITPGTVLFIDEIHRFNKGQQDALLQAVESGIITLIGATTENPSFEVNSALLSRCRIFTLKPLSEPELTGLLENALKTDEHLKTKKVHLAETSALLRLADGDARTLLNLLEITVEAGEAGPGNEITITDAVVMEAAQTKAVMYDKKGEMHYDIISAFIKSLRGSDPNAAIYWMARMIEGGEDPKFIARRMLILASEDIGNANPTALVMATGCFQAVTYVGYPEAEIILSQTAAYLAASAKSNAAVVAIGKAKGLVQKFGNLPVPLHLRNAPTKFMKQEGYGKDYKYAHNYEHNFINQEFMPPEIAGTNLYQPGKNAREDELRVRLKHFWGEKYGY